MVLSWLESLYNLLFYVFYYKKSNTLHICIELMIYNVLDAAKTLIFIIIYKHYFYNNICNI